VYNVNWVVPPGWYIPQKWWGHVPPSSYGGAALEHSDTNTAQIWKITPGVAPPINVYSFARRFINNLVCFCQQQQQKRCTRLSYVSAAKNICRKNAPIRGPIVQPLEMGLCVENNAICWRFQYRFYRSCMHAVCGIARAMSVRSSLSVLHDDDVRLLWPHMLSYLEFYHIT